MRRCCLMCGQISAGAEGLLVLGRVVLSLQDLTLFKRAAVPCAVCSLQVCDLCTAD